MAQPQQISQFLGILKGLFAGKKGADTLHAPEFDAQERKWLNDCLDSGWVSTAGPFVPKFEAELAQATGIPHVVATANGTAALHICLLLANVKPGDEVLVPSLTFVATANAVVYCGATPHFVEASETTLAVDPVKLEKYLHASLEKKGGQAVNRKTGRPVTALVVMHTFGHPAELDELAEICAKFGIVLVEDAAEALGSLYNGKHVGSVGRIGALSFNGNKIVTTGGGGAIISTDKKIAEHAKHLSTTAKKAHAWAFVHDEVGYNYRMPNLNAALGCAQLSKLPQFLREKRTLAKEYQHAFSGYAGKFFVEPTGTASNYWLNAVLLPKADIDLRNQLIEASIAAGFGVRPIWTLMHRLQMYTDCPRMDLSVSENIEARLVNLPSSPQLGRAQ